MKINRIIDCEVRLVHKKARIKNFMKNSREVIIKDIYKHKKIERAVKLWDIETLIKSMDKNSIKYAVVSGLAWSSALVQKENNKYVENCLKKHNDRLLGFYNLSLNNIKKAVKEVLNLDKKLYAGIEIIPKWQNLNINDKKIIPVVKAIKKRNMCLKIYTAHLTQTLDGDSPYRTLEFIKKNQNIKIIVPHLGGLLSIYALLPKIKKILKNVHFITSVSSTMEMVKFSNEVNSKNLLFGTDFPFNHCFNQSEPIKKLHKLKISNISKKNILINNAQRLFKFK